MGAERDRARRGLPGPERGTLLRAVSRLEARHAGPADELHRGRGLACAAGTLVELGPLQSTAGGLDASGRPPGCGDEGGYSKIDPAPLLDGEARYLYVSTGRRCATPSPHAECPWTRTISVIPLAEICSRRPVGVSPCSTPPRAERWAPSGRSWRTRGRSRAARPTCCSTRAALHGHVRNGLRHFGSPTARSRSPRATLCSRKRRASRPGGGMPVTAHQAAPGSSTRPARRIRESTRASDRPAPFPHQSTGRSMSPPAPRNGRAVEPDPARKRRRRGSRAASAKWTALTQLSGPALHEAEETCSLPRMAV